MKTKYYGNTLTVKCPICNKKIVNLDMEKDENEHFKKCKHLAFRYATGDDTFDLAPSFPFIRKVNKDSKFKFPPTLNHLDFELLETVGCKVLVYESEWESTSKDYFVFEK